MAEINASISSMGYGYQVKVLINGIDIGVKGRQSESKRLFNMDHPMRSQATPEMQAQLFVLKPGENTIHIEFQKTGTPEDQLTLEIYLGDTPAPAVLFKTTDASGIFDQILKI